MECASRSRSGKSRKETVNRNESRLRNGAGEGDRDAAGWANMYLQARPRVTGRAEAHLISFYTKSAVLVLAGVTCK